MYTYSFAAEFLSFIISLILFVFTSQKKTRNSSAQRIFLGAVVLNIFNIFLNLLTLADLEYAEYLPVWFNYGINSIYFACCFVMIALYCIYLIEKLLSHVYDKNVQIRFIRFIVLVNVIALLLLIINYPTGIIFYFSENCKYTHGKFWVIGYAVVTVMFGMIFYCFKRYYSKIDSEGKRFLCICIPVLFMLFIYQIVYPDFLLNGTMGAFVSCLCYLCFESHREEIDPVTKLGSLSAFLSRLDLMENNNEPYHIIVVNLKKYGNINTSFGFTKGNEILYYLADWLQKWFSDGEVYRFAPVSFGVILPCDRTSRNIHLERIRKLHSEFPRMIEIGHNKYMINSFFAELFSDECSRQSSKIMEALEYTIQTAKKEDLEMLTFDSSMRKQLERRKYLIEYMEQALEERKFEMWYQPIYCNRTGLYCSAEALMRLKDREGRYISPEEFIQIAEETGMIAEISKQTFDGMLNLLKDAEGLGICHVSINLSMQQLQSSEYMQQMFDLMEKNNLPQNIVSYEITERMLVSRDHHMKEVLQQMIEKGNILLMDDFGTGYSNFSMVLDYPFKKIKIDKSILYSSEKDDYKMILMLVQLFHAYGKEIVVEGVETKEQAEKLHEIGVDFIQGYYYAKPMPEKEFREFLQKALQM